MSVPGGSSLEEEADFHYERASDLFYNDERISEALSHIYTTLDIQPYHVEALILAGEIYSLQGVDLQIEDSAAQNRALDFFGRALSLQWLNAGAWAGKALALLYLCRLSECLECTERGLMVLPLSIGQAANYPPVHTNIAESLFDIRTRALLAMGRKDEARLALHQGLEYCPGSSFLTELVPEVATLE